MRIKERGICASLAVVALATGAVILALLAPRTRPGVTESDYQTLGTGLTQADVERQLHGPPRNGLRHTAIIWLPQATGKPRSAFFEPTSPAVDAVAREDLPRTGRQGLKATAATDFFPQVTPKLGHQALWVTRTGLIEIGRAHV